MARVQLLGRKGAREDGQVLAPLTVSSVSAGPAVPWGAHVPVGSAVFWDTRGSVQITLWDAQGSMYVTEP